MHESLLTLGPNLTDPDGFYAALAAIHSDLDAETAARVTMRLVLLLANHIGDQAVLDDAIARARDSTRA